MRQKAEPNLYNFFFICMVVVTGQRSGVPGRRPGEAPAVFNGAAPGGDGTREGELSSLGQPTGGIIPNVAGTLALVKFNATSDAEAMQLVQPPVQVPTKTRNAQFTHLERPSPANQWDGRHLRAPAHHLQSQQQCRPELGAVRQQQ